MVSTKSTRGRSRRIASGIRKQSVKVAIARSGVTLDTESLECALATGALEDGFGRKLIAREGRVPRDIDLEF
jgi:hypothetical protein